MSKTPEEKYKCLLCGRVMNAKAPHNCNHGFRKRGLKWSNLTTLKPVVKENLTSEERAREYVLNMNFSNSTGVYIENEIKGIAYQSYIDSYHSRDEEVKELREALKECIENIECVEANVNHSEGFFNSLMNATVFCEQAKQLLKED